MSLRSVLLVTVTLTPLALWAPFLPHSYLTVRLSAQTRCLRNRKEQCIVGHQGVYDTSGRSCGMGDWWDGQPQGSWEICFPLSSLQATTVSFNPVCSRKIQATISVLLKFPLEGTKASVL